jgi:hypothetical protein
VLELYMLKWAGAVVAAVALLASLLVLEKSVDRVVVVVVVVATTLAVMDTADRAAHPPLATCYGVFTRKKDLLRRLLYRPQPHNL